MVQHMTSVSNHDTRLYFGRTYAVWRAWHWASFPNKLFAEPTRQKAFPSQAVCAARVGASWILTTSQRAAPVLCQLLEASILVLRLYTNDCLI